MKMTPHAWYAVMVKAHLEKAVGTRFSAMGYEKFVPSYNAVRRIGSRKRKVERALFPGYVFCRFNASDRLPVLTAPYVLRIVGNSLGPTPIPDIEIESLKRVVATDLQVVWPFLKTGMRVKIVDGPLAGVEGVLDTEKGTSRLVVSISMLQRSIAVEVDRDCVAPALEPKPPRQATVCRRSATAG